jgi:coenzyme F420-reducing hydrogenase beta subunit
MQGQVGTCPGVALCRLRGMFIFCPENKISLVDIEDVSAPDHQPLDEKPEQQDLKRWGAFSQVWEGYASDPEIRLKGSTGGLCTALSLFCLEQKIAGGVIHVGSDPEKTLEKQNIP